MAKDCSQRRAELLQTFAVPTLEDAANSLGPLLSTVVLNTMSQKAQLLMGVQRPLSTVPDSIWIAPQTRLDGGRIVQTVPDQLVCLQACTHKAILEMGSHIEQKMHKDKEAAVQQAKRDTELFEKFECAQRIRFSVNNELIKQKHQLDEKYTQMMADWHEEREQMMKSHKDAIEFNSAMLRRELQLEADRRLREEVVRLEKDVAESECRWQLEVAILKAFISDAQQRQDSAVGQTKTDYLRIFKKLFVGFELELQAQRDTLQCKHMAELLHAICIEKELAFNDVKTDSNATGVINASVPETPMPSHDTAVPPTGCPNVLKFLRRFASILKQYTEFVEWSLGKAYCLRQFLIPLEKHLQSLMLQPHHTENSCGCQCVDFEELDDFSFIRADMTEIPKEPFRMAACKMQSEPSIARVPSAISNTSSSLSCFNLDGTIYASNLHYLEILNRLYPNDELSIDWKITDDAIENDESRLYSEDLNEHIQYHISAATIKIEQELRMVDSSESIRSSILQRRLKRLVGQVLSTYHDQSAHKYSCQQKQVDQTELKILSVVDSVEIMRAHQQSRSHISDVFLSARNDFETQSELQKFTIGTQTEGTFIGDDLQPPGGPDFVINRAGFPLLSNDEYMRSRQKTPLYMRPSVQSNPTPDTIWNRYRVTTDAEWQQLLVRADAEMPDKRVQIAEQCSIVVEPPVRQKVRSILRSSKPTEQIYVFDSFAASNAGCLTTERLLKRMKEDSEIVKLLNISE